MNTTESINPITGVRDLRSALEWYDSGYSRSNEGISTQIGGVWQVICGKSYRTNKEPKHETIEEMYDHLLENRSTFVGDKLSKEDVVRVLALFRGLSEVDNEYRVYGEDRERDGRFDYRTRCFVGLYHVTAKTTLVTYLHKSQGMGTTIYSTTGVTSPRRDVEVYLRDEVFYSDYDYTRLD